MKACNQCGKCCLVLAAGAGLGTAEQDDIQRWEDEWRDDIFAYCPPPIHDMWISPRTRDDTQRCPWLRKLPNQDRYNCRIYDVRPNVCRRYPLDIRHMLACDCEMLEPSDLERPITELRAELDQLRSEDTQ